jgi:iron complex transport system substrate-binding protein
MSQLNTPGNGHNKKALHFHHPPKRVVSLVPSLTESMFDLGLGEYVVGITDYCIHPGEGVANLPRLGGPKDPRLAEIIDLQPELVLANMEENTRLSVESLEAHGLAVWVTFPKSVRQSLDVLWTLVGLFRSQVAVMRLEMLELTLDWAISAAAERPSLPGFCPIWSELTPNGVEWWMTFNQETYCHDLLALLGFQNVFGERRRLYPLEADLGLAQPEDPGERDTRYPRVTRQEIEAAQPQVMLLPSEPFAFNENHCQHLAEILPTVPAVRRERVYLVDGSLITWPGTRLAHALRELPAWLMGE